MKNFSLRISDEHRQRLEKLAEYLGVQPAELIRQSVEAMLVAAEANGGRILFPLRFESVIDEISKGARVFKNLDEHTMAALQSHIAAGKSFHHLATEAASTLTAGELADLRAAWIFAAGARELYFQAAKETLGLAPEDAPNPADELAAAEAKARKRAKAAAPYPKPDKR